MSRSQRPCGVRGEGGDKVAALSVLEEVAVNFVRNVACPFEAIQTIIPFTPGVKALPVTVIVSRVVAD